MRRSPPQTGLIARYLLMWLLLALLAVVNGAVREATYGQHLSTLAAHQLATLIGVVLMAAVVFGISRLWPINSAKAAWKIGSLWLLMTVCFEFLFGHYVAGHSWALLLHDYNLLQGRVWAVFLLATWLMPYLAYRLRR